MSRRIVAPVLLLFTAALSIAAVFVVHDIESAGGPLSEPSVQPPSFSPNGDDIQDTVTISFTTKRAEQISVVIVDERGQRVARLLSDEHVDGEREVAWDGTADSGGTARDGTYAAVITRAGDNREYSPTKLITLDTRPPAGALDRATLEDGVLRGLALLPEHAELVVADDAHPAGYTGMRAFRPRDANAVSAKPHGAVPPGTSPIRFLVDVGDTTGGFRFYSQELAGNRTTLRGWAMSVNWVTP